MIDERGSGDNGQDLSEVEVFTDLDRLIAAYPESGANAR
jgi:hypothetical protein